MTEEQQHWADVALPALPSLSHQRWSQRKDRGHTGMGSVQGGDGIIDSLPAAHGDMFPPLPVL